MSDEKIANVSSLIKAWVDESAGWFTYGQLDSDLNIKSREAKTLRRVVILNLIKEGLVERKEGKNGVFRRYQTELKEIDWQKADASATIDLKFPFDIQNYVKIFPKSIIVIAGESNSGKTAFLYNFIMSNYENHTIDLYNSETSAEQMKERAAARVTPQG